MSARSTGGRLMILPERACRQNTSHHEPLQPGTRQATVLGEMAIDFSFPPEVEDVRQRVRAFMQEEVEPGGRDVSFEPEHRSELVMAILRLRQRAQALSLFNPHMPSEWGGLGL